jgi:hypothetical protein
VFLCTLFLQPNYYSFLNFAERSASDEAEMDHSDETGAIETSRTIIRAASLNPLPGVHVPSINQVVSLGS